MKVLLAGGFHFSWYEEACARALESGGVRVSRFSWRDCFAGVAGCTEQRLLLRGPSTRALEEKLLAFALREQPDVIWIWRGRHLGPTFVAELRRRTGAFCVSYNNDDPFSPAYGRGGWLRPNPWRTFVAAIPEYDLNFVYRPVNVDEYGASGARAVAVLPPYFIREMHRPVELTPAELERYGCDFVFVGHHEDDSRVEALRALVDQGYRLRLFGNGWPAAAVRAVFGEDRRVQPVLGDAYVRALCGASVCLAFLSKLNRDTYTRRSFEIPACGAVMLSESSPDLPALFTPGSQAEYFRDIPELLNAARRLTADAAARRRIGAAARRRAIDSGYDAEGRMAGWVRTTLEHIKAARADSRA